MDANWFWQSFPDVPPGERPPPAINLTMSQEAGGWVLRWQGPEQESDKESSVLYYTVEKRKDNKGEPWIKLAEYIDVEEASYMSKQI